jgi:hypothetical protein
MCVCMYVCMYVCVCVYVSVIVSVIVRVYSQGLPNSFIILTHLTQLNLSSNQGFSKIVPHQIYRF